MNDQPDISRIKSRITGQGSPLILLPGLGLNLHIFDALTARLEKEYQCVCLDFSGDVPAAMARDCTIDSITEEVRAWLMANHIEPHCFIGHSLGGFVGMQLATRYPDLVSSLVLMSTAAQGDASLFDLFVPSEMMSPAVLLRRNMEMSVFGNFKDSEAFRDALAMQTEYSGCGKCFMPLLRAATGFNIIDELRRIECPTLIISGREDTIATPNLAAQLASRIRSNVMITFENVGHLPQIEVPTQVSVGIMSFLKKVVTGLITMPIVPITSRS